MRKSLGGKIAITALSLFLAGKSLSALTPANISDIETAFESNGNAYLVLQDGTITPAKEKGKFTLGKEGKWISENGNAMSAQFQSEAAKVLKVEKEKENKGIKLIDFFEYTNAKGAANCFNLWSDGTITFGPYQIASQESWFYDANGNGKMDKGESYMRGAFNTKANQRVIVSLSEIASLRGKVGDLEATIAGYQGKAAADPKKSKDYLDLAAESEKAKQNYEHQIGDLTAQVATLTEELAADKKVGNGVVQNSDSSLGNSTLTIPNQDLMIGILSEQSLAEQSLGSSYFGRINLESLNANSNNSVPPYSNIPNQWQMAKDFQDALAAQGKVLPEPELPKAKPAYKGATLIADGEFGFNSEKFNAEVGMRYDAGNLGIGARVGIGMGGEKVIDSYEGTPSETTGRKDVGTTTRDSLLKLKASLEARLGLSKNPADAVVSLIAEGGIVYTPFTDNTDEQIVGRSGNVLAEDSYSVPGSQIDYFGGAGFEIGKVGKLKFRILMGGETGEGAYGKLGIGIPLSKN
jgi:hypothetical protein